MRTYFIAAILLLTANLSFAGKIVLDGVYQNKNIYVINSVAVSGAGFCTYEVAVNGDISTDEINSNAFEIDLSIYDLELGEDVYIEIMFKDGCAPKVLNPGVLKPQPSFETQSISIDRSGLLEWETTNESAVLPFVVQQFKWNKWVKVGEVEGQGTPQLSNYKFKVVLTSGNNKFRVMQRNHDHNIKISRSVSITSMRPKPSFVYNRKSQLLEFSRKTSFEVQDVYGRVTKAGYGLRVNVRNLPKGTYYLNYDNSTAEFVKK